MLYMVIIAFILLFVIYVVCWLNDMKFKLQDIDEDDGYVLDIVKVKSGKRNR